MQIPAVLRIPLSIRLEGSPTGLVLIMSLRIAVPLALLTAIGLFFGVNGVVQIVPTGEAPTVQTNPREVGSAYDVLEFCDDTATKVTVDPNGTESKRPSTRYQLRRGLEEVNWPDTGTNPMATHYYQDATGVQLSEAVEVTKPAAACIRAKAGK